MASVPLSAPPGFDDLPVEQKLDYVEALWTRIASKPDRVPVPEWHRQVLAQRLEAYRASQGGSRPWAQFRDDLYSLLRPPAK